MELRGAMRLSFQERLMNDEGRNRCLCDYFACSENSIVSFLYIVIENSSYHLKDIKSLSFSDCHK
jgi:hypothetical protein